MGVVSSETDRAVEPYVAGTQVLMEAKNIFQSVHNFLANLNTELMDFFWLFSVIRMCNFK